MRGSRQEPPAVACLFLIILLALGWLPRLAAPEIIRRINRQKAAME